MNEQSKSIFKASMLAFVIALVALVLVILPAEYDIDPTGIGAKLGLTVFNQEISNAHYADSDVDGELDALTIVVPAGKGIEYKLAMAQYQKVTYQWRTQNGELYFDLHGEPEGDTSGYFESYTIATSGKMKGSFIAPFDGSHGWYWRNDNDQDITVELIIEGQYVIQGLKP